MPVRFNSLSTLILLIFGIAVSLPSTILAQEEPFALGADISWIPEREAGGVKYAHNGQVSDILDILGDHKFNYIRLRLFVDPTVDVPEDVAAGEKGEWRASPYSKAGYCGLESTIAMAKRVKAANMKFLLDFHYSDTWADPGKQYKPVSWRGLTFSQLTEKVRTYTKESLEAFKENGVLPDMVQVGNEVVGGMIHPDGSTGNWNNFAALVNAGIKGVKDVDPDIKIMMHTISERNPNNWLTTLKTRLNQIETNAAGKIDVVGLSYYPRWHGDLDSLGRILTAISKSHDIKIAVVEYADKHREVNDLVFALPENRRFGTFVWEPQEFSGDNSLPLFDWRNNRRETNSRIALYPVMAEAYGINGGPTNIINKNIPSGAVSGAGFSVSSRGVIVYNSNVPAAITVCNINGRVMGRMNVSSPGIYKVERILQTPLRSGVCIIAIEPHNGGKLTFKSKILK
ncbi:MAG: arabinogalactan endo-1,4-beta-galactosidase [Chitinispirillales bacterium]|jgi:arabinogalactan endo-1,4-beta-galactosidase|nr:arabinogalactan endo-1,4-beta-galactosidase [Chitinispirillales bacterium]